MVASSGRRIGTMKLKIRAILILIGALFSLQWFNFAITYPSGTMLSFRVVPKGTFSAVVRRSSSFFPFGTTRPILYS